MQTFHHKAISEHHLLFRSVPLCSARVELLGLRWCGRRLKYLLSDPSQKQFAGSCFKGSSEPPGRCLGEVDSSPAAWGICT